uniref:Superfamily II DNA or RNA helicase n=1 Tax=Candidatus Kentrum sp. TUN TaxID=2126343 RepID=A0A451ACS8_9GAMM|nr:MAG: Superfamily II DNA or RNA helicase [Candidatus Kentron sp. TUN]
MIKVHVVQTRALQGIDKWKEYGKLPCSLPNRGSLNRYTNKVMIAKKLNTRRNLKGSTSQPDSNPFQNRRPNIAGNQLIRTPQIEAYAALAEFTENPGDEREVGIVLPVGCGKSGCITLAPFAFGSKRTLVVAPGLKIADQLCNDFDPTKTDMFYIKCDVLQGQPYPEPVEIRGTTTNRDDLDEAHVVITNIQQLQRQGNRWLEKFPPDYFDLILFDEGHHSVAETYKSLKTKFLAARIVNFSATPLRADGQLMAGKVLYSYPIFRAIQEGYVKRLKALVLNPKTLKYVRRKDDQEIEVSLDEVRKLGEKDADFRRSIVTSKETLTTIVDASIRELDRIRAETDNRRHKIIASALNYQHCIQIVEEYRARGRNAEFVHSREDSTANDRVLKKLEAHELDVIVQVRKLGEGFDHPYLSVAAVFSIFANLSPFVQFVGRIMRVIRQNSPNDLLNQGTVVFHAGANIAARWEDFQEYSEADRQFFDQLLPLEEFDLSQGDEILVTPVSRAPNTVEIRSQKDVLLEEIPLLNDKETMKAIEEVLRARGYSLDDMRQAMKHQPVLTTKAKERQAARKALDSQIQNEVGRILGTRNINPKGKDLDKRHLNKSNFVVVKAAIDKQVNATVGKSTGNRHEFSRTELDTINARFPELVAAAEKEVFGA